MSGILSFFSDAWSFISNLVVTIITELRSVVDLFIVILRGDWWRSFISYIPAVFVTSAVFSLVLIVILRLFGRR